MWCQDSLCGLIVSIKQLFFVLYWLRYKDISLVPKQRHGIKVRGSNRILQHTKFNDGIYVTHVALKTTFASGKDGVYFQKGKRRRSNMKTLFWEVSWESLTQCVDVCVQRILSGEDFDAQGKVDRNISSSYLRYFGSFHQTCFLFWFFLHS